DDSGWATPSLCAGFTVREVLAHLTATGSLGAIRWFAGVLRCRFDFDRQVSMRLAEQLGSSGPQTLARFRSTVASTTCPPLPRLALLGEVIVHAQDIRHPLAVERAYPIDTLTAVARYYRGADQVVLAKGRVADLRLVATDGPFAAGDGPLVSGPTVALVMAMTGRGAYCQDLTGDGVPVLRERC
ncbi:MAG TPA: maleylpyruvate isomerase family mycothiol-dependent enzyme, partial [Nakamurella sp.]